MSDSMIIGCPSCGTKNRIPLARTGQRGRCGRCSAPLPVPGTVVELGDQNFRQVIQGTRVPVLVDFYSPTCGPCQMMAPVIEELARRYQGRVLVAKYDTSRNQAVAAGFQIRGVPTLIFFRDGQPVDQVVGAVPGPELEQRLAALL